MKLVQLFTGGNPYDGNHPGFLKVIDQFVKNGYKVIIKNLSHLRNDKSVATVRKIEYKQVFLLPSITKRHFPEVTEDYFNAYLKGQPLTVLSWRRSDIELTVEDKNGIKWIINSNWTTKIDV